MTKRAPKIVYTNELIENQVTYDLMAYQKIIKKKVEWPVDLDFLAKSLWGMEIMYEENIELPNTTDEVVGYLNVKNKIISINLNANRGRGRLNFTLAHEIGHASLHSTLSKSLSTNQVSDIIYCRKDREKNDQTSTKLEQQANYYASCLLLPKALLLGELDCNSLIDLSQEADKIMDRFQVSRYALELRLFKLGFRTANNKYVFK